MRRARTASLIGVALVTAAALSGCDLGAALGQVPPTTGSVAPSTAVAGTSSSAAPTPAAEVQLAVVPGAGDGADDLLTVTRGEVQVGYAPPLTDWPESCGVDDAALEYVPLTIGFSGAELAGRLTVTSTGATPANVAPIGVFFDDATDLYCQGDPAFPSSDTFWSHGNGNQTTAYVVLQDAVGPTTPQGRPDVVSSREIRLDHLRRHASGDAPLTLTTPTVGALCPDDADAICVPLP